MPQDRLHELIHSLSQSEKRYFKQYLNRFSNTNSKSIYTRLYDYIAHSKKYDREALLLKCDFIKASQLQNIRTRLYDYILESLRAYKSSSSDIIALHELMINYEILVNKSLFVQSWKLLQKAEQIARDSEHLYMLEDILAKQEYIATTRLKDKKINEIVKKVQEKRDKVLSLKNTHIQVKNLYIETYSIFKTYGRIARDPSHMKPMIFKLEDLSKEVNCYEDSYKIQYDYNRTLAIAYGHSGHFAAALDCMEKIMGLFEKNKKYLTLHLRDYLFALNRLIIDLNTNEKFDEALLAIASMRKIIDKEPKNKELQLLAFENANFQELEIYIKRKDYKYAVDFMEHFIPDISLLEEKINTVNQQSKFYRISLAYFGNGDYKKALQWINKILNSNKIKYRKDILASIQLLNLLIHYQLENYNLLSYRLSSTKSYLKKIERWLPFEEALISSISAIVIAGENEKQTFSALSEKLKQIEKESPLEKFAMAYFDIQHWLSNR